MNVAAVQKATLLVLQLFKFCWVPVLAVPVLINRNWFRKCSPALVAFFRLKPFRVERTAV